MLTPAQLESYGQDGYLVIPDFVSAEQCRRLRRRAAELIDDFAPDSHHTVFSTEADARPQDRDDYFLASGDKIRFFLEAGAVDATGRLTCPKDRAINKIGHAMHDLDPVFSEFSRNPRLAEIIADLGVHAPKLLQSMFIAKQPQIGGEVTLHQDAPFLYTDPVTVVGLWFALEPADRDNGCLQVLPGGHLAGLKSRYRRTDGGAAMEILDPSPWPEGDLVAVPAATGTLVILHGLLPHFSAENRSDRSRHAYTLHVIDGAADYPEDNWLRRGPDLPLRGF